MCSRCLATSFRPKTDPTMSKKIEARYERLLIPLFDDFEKKAVAAFESKARALAAPAVEIDLDWLRAYLEKTIELTITKPAAGPQSKIVTTAYKQGITWADTAIKAIGMDVKLGAGPIDRRALDVLQSRNRSALTKLTYDLNAGIIDGLTEGLMQGEGITDLTKRVQNACQAIGKTRAETIARTETMYAVNQGTLIRYSQAGIARVKWLTGIDGAECVDCNELHGQEFDIDDVPDLPQHPRCRCTVTPVIQTESI
ncbi:MAG TPA: minor capsid protein [Methanoregulaceae archaeon]|nr:minor capsid protein [Methanoregulaceae archaeon]